MANSTLDKSSLIRSASVPPIAAVTMPEAPITAAARRSVLSLARLRHVPMIAAAMITAADVPLATTGSMPNSEDHRRHHDDAAADAEQAGEDPGDEPDDDEGDHRGRRSGRPARRRRWRGTGAAPRRRARTMKMIASVSLGQDVEEAGADRPPRRRRRSASHTATFQSTLPWAA